MTNVVLPLAALGVFIVALLFACALCSAADAGDAPLPRNPWDEYGPEVADERPRQRARQH